ncbi:SseB family protein [Microbacterium mitrae]|uniref:SseB family protein n=1 Tax=Microbacterium mitrae TaxID=664640 RepID=A0A5C8HPF4_9MICO|nr:SseB family protein [Microbacterium mitrae]TXK04674.1 SseB family protein [Microbacterium mitrae]
MSPETNSADSAGVPWEGRRFEPNPAAGDDGSADPALYAALTNFRNGSGDQIAIVEALRTARVLIPLIAEKGEEGVAPSGLAVDKTQELSIVTVAAPDGRTVLPIFTSVDAMRTWDPLARPIPVAGVRAALSAASDQTDLIVIDPTAETEYIVRRPAVWALAQDVPWVPSAESPEVFAALQESVATELAVIDLTMASGDPQARLHGPELVVSLELVDGLDQTQLDAVLQRLAQRWAADNRVAVLVDSLSVKLVRSAS